MIDKKNWCSRLLATWPEFWAIGLSFLDTFAFSLDGLLVHSGTVLFEQWKKLYLLLLIKNFILYAEGISWMFSVIVGHIEGFLFFQIIFPAKRSIFAFCMSYIRFYRYNWDILGHFQCILWGIRFLLMQ